MGPIPYPPLTWNLYPTLPHPSGQTDACENITFQQLLLRAVIRRLGYPSCIMKEELTGDVTKAICMNLPWLPTDVDIVARYEFPSPMNLNNGCCNQNKFSHNKIQ